MFDFFGPWQGGINTGYWSEKLEAGAGYSACELLAKEYDHDAFCRSLKESMSEYLEDTPEDQQEDEDWDYEEDTPDSDKAKVREVVRELCRGGFSNDWEACQAVYNADWPESWSAGCLRRADIQNLHHPLPMDPFCHHGRSPNTTTRRWSISRWLPSSQ